MINGGFFVLNPSVIDLIDNDATTSGTRAINDIGTTGELMAFEHPGFWQPMDTLRDKVYLEGLWEKVKLRGKPGSN